MSNFFVNLPPGSGGGGGIASINGNTTSAQVIAAGTGIVVSSVGGTTTISDAAWSPTQSAASKLTWESDVLLTASGGSVVGWEDQSSGETMVTLGNSPTLVASQLNGLPAVRYNGTDQALSGGPTDYVENSRAYTIYLVVKPTAFSGTAYYTPIYLPNSAGVSRATWILITNDPAYGEIGLSNTAIGGNINSGPIGLVPGTAQVVRIYYNGQGAAVIGNYTFTIGGTSAQGQTLSGSSESGVMSTICSGRRFISNDSYYKGDIFGIYYFNTNCQANGVDALMTTYLLAKYGIS